jgi:predicted ArsR family transcriptional regulator
VTFRRKPPRTEAGASHGAWSLLGLLAEPRRREVYDFVAMQDGPVTRDRVSEGLSMTRSLAAFHLDKLADAGLLDFSFTKQGDRPGGPGAGRPSKLYAVSARELDVSIPPRRYDIAGRIMARAIAASSSRRSEPAADIARRLANEEGRNLGEQYAEPGRMSAKKTLTVVEGALANCGYEPTLDGQTVRLRNCPFHSLVDVAPRLVCELNESFVTGVIAGMRGDQAVAAELCGPIDGDCCVVVHPAKRKSRPKD